MIISKSPNCCHYRPQFFITKAKPPKYSFRNFSPSKRLHRPFTSINQKEEEETNGNKISDTFFNNTKLNKSKIEFRLTLSRDYIEKQNSNTKEKFSKTFQFYPTIPKISSKFKPINPIIFEKLLGRKELFDNSKRMLQDYHPNYKKIFENDKGLIIDYNNMIDKKPLHKDLSEQINFRNPDNTKLMMKFVSSNEKRVQTPDLGKQSSKYKDFQKLPSYMC